MRKKFNNLRHLIESFQTLDLLNRVSANIMISRRGIPIYATAFRATESLNAN